MDPFDHHANLPIDQIIQKRTTGIADLSKMLTVANIEHVLDAERNVIHMKSTTPEGDGLWGLVVAASEYNFMDDRRLLLSKASQMP